MFRKRRNSQKPKGELYDCFRRNYPNLGPSSMTPSLPTTSSETQPSLATSSSTRRMAVNKAYGDNELDKVPDVMFNDHDNWRLTPSLLDSNSFSFTHFANHDPADLVPTSSAMDAMLHSKAGDLHTPGFSFQLGTPLSLNDHSASTSIGPHRSHIQPAHQQHFGAKDDMSYQSSFAPSAFLHRDSGYETMGWQQNTPSSRKLDSELDHQEMTRFAGHRSNSFSNIDHIAGASMEKFRYYATLNAPTAMIKQSDEIPITYLNKGQAYAISINDTLAPRISPVSPQYRTTVRISFEDNEQRLRPASCWQLWKEGRGSAEAHQRAGRLQAVEFVDQSQNDNETVKCRPRINLEMTSFDSFAVKWSPAPASTDCNIAVRFNFLSTDFSHSKGVKGIPVRLCAKTELLSSGTPESASVATAEVSFCKVKLFRDHGAERKLSNDVAHIKKTIEKVQQQIAQIEIGLKDGAKRKRNDPKSASHRPSKVAKHKRSCSVSSQNSNGRPMPDDDLHVKLAVLQDMFSSTRPVSVLHLKGDEQDDPDAYPVTLPGEPINSSDVPRVDRRESWETVKQSPHSTPPRNHSPTSTTMSVAAGGPISQSQQQAFHRPVAYDPSLQPQSQPHPQPEWEQLTHFSSSNFATDSTTTVSRQPDEGGAPTWLEASGVDHTYVPVPEKSDKPVACLYVLDRTGGQLNDHHYKAVYLKERTLACLVRGISSKCDLDPSTINDTFRLNSKGLKILVDDDVVRQLPEGQDMGVEFVRPDGCAPVKRGRHTGHISPTTTTPSNPESPKIELRLFY